jgi:hypothetical protein
MCLPVRMSNSSAIPQQYYERQGNTIFSCSFTAYLIILYILLLSQALLLLELHMSLRSKLYNPIASVWCVCTKKVNVDLMKKSANHASSC